MIQNRLPYILSQQTIERKIFWINDLETLNINYNLHMSPVDILDTNITSYVHKIQQLIISHNGQHYLITFRAKITTNNAEHSTDLGDNNYIYQIHINKSVQYIL
jgi:hypothetical protein